ncbi:hypothetical protein AAZX31_16G128200 [Glycine max]
MSKHQAHINITIKKGKKGLKNKRTKKFIYKLQLMLVAVQIDAAFLHEFQYQIIVSRVFQRIMQDCCIKRVFYKLNITYNTCINLQMRLFQEANPAKVTTNNKSLNWMKMKI